jgi:calcium load-activated calcium channel
MYSAFAIIGISLFSACFTEFLSWLFIYRRPDYQRVKRSIESLQSKVDKLKSEAAGANQIANKPRDKKIAHLDAQISILQRDIAMTRLKSTFIVGFALVAVFAVFNSLYDQRIVAKLPYEPIGFIKNFSSRGLTSADPTDCAHMFLYILSNIAFRPSVQRLTGFQPPQPANPLLQGLENSSK